MSEIGPKCCEKAQRGRPKKRPEYNREREINDLIQRVIDLYGTPYDDRDERPPDATSINSIAQQLNISRLKVRKLLITADYYSSAESREVKRLHDSGYDVDQICQQTGKKKQTVNSLLPYRKGVYKLEDPPLYAENCRSFRKRKQVCEQLSEHLDEDGCCRFLWNAIQAFEHYPFRKLDGSRIQYSINCDQLCFGHTTRCREEVEAAFHKIRDLQRKDGCVKWENCPCCEELYTIFLRIGACNS